MHFNAHISVVIGNKQLKTVVRVATKNESQNLGSSCDVVVPLNCRIQYQDGKHDYLTDQVKNLFKVGDPISITAYYDGYSQVQVFKGFVYDFVLGTPATIKCLDYVYLLRQTTLNLSHKTITLKNLVQNYILKGTGISLMLPCIDFNLVDISFALMSPAGVLEYIKKELGLNISLHGNQLYMNIASNTQNVVKMDSSINVISADLQKPDSVYKKIHLKAWFLQANGKKDSIEVGDPNGEMKEVWFNKVQRDLTLYNKLAQEALVKYSQYKYGGTITTMLYPDCQLFDKLQYNDVRYPDRTANYVITGRNFSADERGFRWINRVAFLADYLPNQYA